jgi:hypothetical protein
VQILETAALVFGLAIPASRRTLGVAVCVEYSPQKFKRILQQQVSQCRCEWLGLVGPMTAKDKLVVLIRLRDTLYFGVRPTLRECGFPPEIVQALAKERLIQLGDKKFGDDLDRYVIEEILPAGHSFISQQHGLRDRLNP